MQRRQKGCMELGFSIDVYFGKHSLASPAQVFSKHETGYQGSIPIADCML